MSYIGPIPKSGFSRNDTLLGFSPLTEVEIARRLAARGLGGTAIEAAAEGAQLGARRGSWQGIVVGAALGLGVVAWAFWRSRPSVTPEPTPSPAKPPVVDQPLIIRASTEPANDNTEPVVAIDPSTDVSQTLADVIPLRQPGDIVEDAQGIAKAVAGPFLTQGDAEAELIRRTATEAETFAAPYAVIQDTHTGHFYIIDIRNDNHIGNSFRFVTYGVKLGPDQSEAAAIPPHSTLISSDGPVRVIGVWSSTNFIITTTIPFGEYNRTLVHQVDMQMSKDGVESSTEFIMLTSTLHPRSRLLIYHSTLKTLLGTTGSQEVEAWLVSDVQHPATGERFSVALKVKIPVKPQPGSVIVQFDPTLGRAYVEYYTSGDIVYRLPPSRGATFPVYVPMEK